MSDIAINYKGNAIATMDASGTKTLLTEGKYCEDDIEVVYVKPGGGGSNSPLVNSKISIPSATNTIDIVLPRAVTNAVVLVEATDSTLTALYALSDTVYRIVSGIFFFPIGSLNNGTKTSGKFGGFERYRQSAATFYAQHGATLSLSGITMTLTLDSATKFVVGTDTYTVKVWEVATS